MTQTTNRFFDEMAKLMTDAAGAAQGARQEFETVMRAQADRVLADRRYLGVYVSDSFKKGRGFVGIGARLFASLERRFRAIDHVAVVRGNRKLEKPGWHKAAEEGNYFLRGFNHLLIFKKERAPRAR